MTGSVAIVAGGEPVELLAGRAVWWPGAETLIVADLHLGKERAFGAAGIAVPDAILADTLDRLRDLVARMGARRVIAVGDLLHARAGLTEDVVERVGAWRARLDAELWLIPGNHDRAFHRVAAPWNVRVCDAEHMEGPFRFTHAPDEGLAGCFTWAGHLHPAVTLAAGADSVRLPCFRLGVRLGVLPAFSRFTGGCVGDLAGAEEAWAVAGDRLVAVPPVQAARR